MNDNIDQNSSLSRARGAGRAFALAASTTVLIAGCGAATKPTEPSLGTVAVATTPTTPANPALAKKPVVSVPKGPAPTTLVVKDLVAGTGPAAKTGSSVSVQYVGVLYSNGRQFDASWDRGGTPFQFTVGSGQVIKGWDQGLVGMKVGGRRELVIPGSLAYGPAGQPPKIGPNAALVFVIDLLSAS